MENFKLVLTHAENDDQELFGFYKTERAAQEARPKIYNQYESWVKDINRLIVKPVNPELIVKPVNTDYDHYVASLIPSEDWKRVMKSDASAEIQANCLMCGGATYYYLSRLIPKDWTVIDIGCAYNPQSYLFQNHKIHIAINPKWNDDDFRFEYFTAPRTQLLKITAGEFIKNVLPTLKLDLNKTFAICNYVPDWHNEIPNELVRHTFKNVYTFYPA